MLMARVKEKSAQPIIVACTGRQYVKTEWRQVPAGMEKEANAQPNLDTLSDARLNPKPKAKKKARPNAKAKAKAKKTNAGSSEAKRAQEGDSKAPPEDEAKAEKETVAKDGE